MAAVLLKTFGALGPAPALLLAALLAAGARADHVTTPECERGSWWRVRRYPTDSNATTLRMISCGLFEINPATYTGLPNLSAIDFRYNHIENINLTALHTVALAALFLDNNKLRALPVFDEWCPSRALALSANQITSINDERTFSACATLNWLDLSSNQIDFIHPSVFRPLTELVYLHLSNNKLRFLPDQILDRNSKLQILTLKNNRLTHLPPDFVSSMKRAGAGLTQFDFHDNPWNCACLLELMADIKKAGVSYYYNPYSPYDGTRAACVYTGAAPCCRHAPSGLLRPRGGR